MRKIVLAVVVACALGAYAEERTVSDAAGLVAALEALNSKTAPAEPNIIYLLPGSYDVSTCHMETWGSSGKTAVSTKHLALANVTVSGKTYNPRDTVIYGNGTDGIAHCYAAGFRHLTISNGCDSTATEDRGGGVNSGTHSNVIVTCCSSGALGGGTAGGTWYDCTIISNRSTTNGGGAAFGTWYNCNIVSNYTAKSGGGIYYQAVLHDCRVIGNRAKTGGGGLTGGNGKSYYCKVYGGVIADNYAGSYAGGAFRTDILGGTVISNNSAASYGGGVCMEAGIVMTNTVICCNTAANGGGVSGKGFCSGCEIYGNTATATGGGFNNGWATNCVIYANSAKDGGGCGTGAYVDCVISNNTASGAGGGAFKGFSTNCLFTANTAARGGAACSNECVSCEIVGNEATYGGGGYMGTFTNCIVSGNSAVRGGGTYGGSCIGVDSLICGNRATGVAKNDGGGGCYSGSYTDCTISNNLALFQGGGGYAGTYTNCLIACNMVTGSVDNVSGGGLKSAVAYRCVISNNVIESFSTVASGATASGTARGAGAHETAIYDSTVVFNANYGSTYSTYGGGMFGGCASNTLITGNACYPAGSTSGKSIQGGGTHTTYLTNCVVRNNFTRSDTATGMNGGSANGCLISNNVGSTAGAYVVRQVYGLQNCEVVGVANIRNGPVVNCRFVNFTNGYFLAQNENVIMDSNMRYHVSGPISRAATTSTSQELIYSGFVATNCLIANNRTSGGLFYALSDLNMRLYNCTVASNVCTYTFLNATNGTHAFAINTIFVGNKNASGAARDMNFPSASKSYVALTNCLIGSGRQAVAAGYEANTVTNDNARFVGGDGPDKYALKRSSPAIGKGLVQDWMTGALDIRQNPACPRLRDGAVDIGCYQCWLDPVGLWFSIR